MLPPHRGLEKENVPVVLLVVLLEKENVPFFLPAFRKLVSNSALNVRADSPLTPKALSGMGHPAEYIEKRGESLRGSAFSLAGAGVDRYSDGYFIYAGRLSSCLLLLSLPP
jgi:hypothetical protein